METQSILDAPAPRKAAVGPWIVALSAHVFALSTGGWTTRPPQDPPPPVTDTVFIDIESVPTPAPPEPEEATTRQLAHAATTAAPVPEVQRPLPGSTPPRAAEAGQVLTQEQLVLDLSHTFVIGSGRARASGASYGRGQAPEPAGPGNARGVSNGRSNNTSPTLPTEHSRPPRLYGGASWNCPFPPEADVENVNQAVVTLLVSIDTRGAVRSADVHTDPGYGFGRAARRCALTKRWEPGLDVLGRPTSASLTVKVRFQR